MPSGAFRLVDFDPALSYKFSVEIDGVIEGQFTECEGLKLEREVIEYKEGGANMFIYKFPGRIKQENIRLRRGVTYSHYFWDWFIKGTLLGRVKRKNISIIVGDASNTVVQRWDLLNAWPVKYEGPELKVDSVQAALELIELAHHGLVLQKEAAMQPMGAGGAPTPKPVAAPPPQTGEDRESVFDLKKSEEKAEETGDRDETISTVVPRP
jgi:phage tail-like protein